MKRFIPIFLIAASVQAKVFNVTDTVVRVRTAASTSLTEAASIEYANSVGLTATPVYVESDPIFTNWFDTNTYVETESDPIWVAASNGIQQQITSNLASAVTGTPIYAESDPIWVANSNLYSLTGADTNYTLKVGDTMTGTHTYTNAILYIAEATNDASPVTYRQLGATLGSIGILYASTNISYATNEYKGFISYNAEVDNATFPDTNISMVVTGAYQLLSRWVSNTGLVTQLRSGIGNIHFRMRFTGLPADELSVRPCVGIVQTDGANNITNNFAICNGGGAVALERDTWMEDDSPVVLTSNYTLLATDAVAVRWNVVAQDGEPTWEFAMGESYVIAARLPTVGEIVTVVGDTFATNMLESIANVTASGSTDGQALTYDGSNWTNVDASSGANLAAISNAVNGITNAFYSDVDTLEIGAGANANNTGGTVVAGPGASASGYDATVLGQDATGTEKDVAVGHDAEAGNSATTIGAYSYSATYSFAGGRAANAAEIYAVALGGFSPVAYKQGIAIGSSSLATNDSAAIGFRSASLVSNCVSIGPCVTNLIQASTRLLGDLYLDNINGGGTQFVFASGIKLIDLTTNLQVVLPGGSLTNLFN